MTRRILVVKHTESEGPGTFADFFGKFRDLQVIDLSKDEELPEDLNKLAAVVVMGGPMGVYQDSLYPFLKDEYFFINRFLEKRIPFLGVCLGAQLLAKSLGAEIKKNKAKELGCCNVRLTDQGLVSDIFFGLPEEFKVFQWHEDTFDLPKDSVLLAESDLCKNQAMRCGSNAYGLQFHVEATPEMITEWVKGEKASEASRIISDAYDENSEMKKTAFCIYENFNRLLE
jgi:GMP synthase-like glutamine amidotransferase